MSVEVDTLKALERIEKALGDSLTFAKARADIEDKEKRNAGSTSATKEPKQSALATRLAAVGNAAQKLTKRFEKLDDQLKNTIDVLAGFKSLADPSLNKRMNMKASIARNRVKPETVSAEPVEKKKKQKDIKVEAPEAVVSAEVPRELTAMGRLFKTTGDIWNKSIIAAGKQLPILTTYFKDSLERAISDVTKDFFYLQSRGISAADSMKGLYGNAIKANMTLQEYTNMLQDNSAAVMRSRSFDDFNAELSATTKSLNGLGVFGPQATQLAASMRTQASSLGISQQDVSAASQAQVKVFEKLRKSTLMTADGFGELMRQVSENENVQAELIGLAPSERKARMTELTNIASLGYQMGMTKDASSRLTQALLDQRRMTVKDRFQAAGGIRQAGAITGMAASDVDEFAKLTMKRNKTDAEMKRFIELGGDLEQRMEQMINSENPAAANMVEQLRSGPLAGLTDMLESARKAKAAKEAGPLVNGDVGKKTSDQTQQVGDALTKLGGILKNPIGDMAYQLGKQLAAIAAQTAIQVFWYKRINDSVRGKGPGGGLLDAVTGGAAGSAKPGESKVGSSLLDRFTSMFKKTETMGPPKPSMLQNPKAWYSSQIANGGTLTKGLTTVLDAFSSFGGMLGKIGPSISGRIGTLGKTMGLLSYLVDGFGAIVTGTAKGWTAITEIMAGGARGIFRFGAKSGPLSFAFGAIEELFTGESTKFLALGDGFGSRVLGALVAGLNSIVTSFTRMFDDGMNWMMEGLGIDFKFNITKLVDYVTSWLTDAVKMATAGLAKAISSTLKFFGFGEGKWAKQLDSAQETIFKSIDESSDNRQRMWETDGATMRSVGKKDLEAQKNVEKAIEKTADSTVAASARITDLNNMVSSANATAGRIQAQVQGTQAPNVATPTSVAKPNITPPEVNKQQVEASKAADTTPESKKQQTIVGLQDLINVAQQQLAVLQQTLDFQKANGQVPFVLPKTQFGDNTTYMSVALGNRN